LSAYQKDTIRLNEELKSLKTAGDIYAKERQDWYELKAARDGLFDSQCQKLTENANGAIRAHVRRYADADEFVERLRESLSGSNVRRERIEAIGRPSRPRGAHRSDGPTFLTNLKDWQRSIPIRTAANAVPTLRRCPRPVLPPAISIALRANSQPTIGSRYR
jgi:hypothetical protein